MENRVGIEQIEALAVAIGKSSSLAVAILSDGKVDLKDLHHLPAVFPALKAFASVDFAALWAQFNDLDDAEKVQLSDTFRREFDLANDSIEDVIEAGFAILMDTGSAIQKLKDIFLKVKGLA